MLGVVYAPIQCLGRIQIRESLVDSEINEGSLTSDCRLFGLSPSAFAGAVVSYAAWLRQQEA